MNDKRKKMLPRDGAGSFSFPPETGAIKRMLGMDGFMEIYTVLATYRVKTPDNLDPSRTLPNMPWSQNAHAHVGSSNPIVARILLQSVDALQNWSLRNGDAKSIKHSLHACKEEALLCEAAYKQLKPGYEAAVALVQDRKVKIQGNMVECPSLQNLRDEATTFLTSAKRALQCVGEVFNQFYAPDGKTPLVKNGNFSFAITRLESLNPSNKNFLEYIRNVEPTTKRFVELRNGLEHPDGNDRTVIEDFRLTPKGIVPPSWHRGNLVEEGQILDEMSAFIEFSITFCEHVFSSGSWIILLRTFQSNFKLRYCLMKQSMPNVLFAFVSNQCSVSSHTLHDRVHSAFERIRTHRLYVLIFSRVKTTTEPN